MKAVLKATTLLGSSAFVTLLSTLIVSKVAAQQLGPEGFGYQGLLVGFVGLMTLLFGVGLGPGLVKFLALAIEQGNSTRLQQLKAAGWYLIWCSIGVFGLLVFIFQDPINQLFFAGQAPLRDLSLGALAVVCSLLNTIYVAILMTEYPAKQLALSIALGSLGAMVVNVAGLLSFGREFIAFSILGIALIPLLVYGPYTLKLAPWSHQKFINLSVRRQLLGFGLPYAASSLVGLGVQFIVPLLIIRFATQESVGYYRVATSISAVYLNFLLNAMGQEYHPRISRTAFGQLESVGNNQMRFLLFIAGPLILGCIFFSRELIGLLFSAAFLPAAQILEVQIMADALKLGCWAFSFIVLSHLSGRHYFLLELVWGIILLFTVVLALRTDNLLMLGYSHLIAYGFYASVTFWMVRKNLNVRLEYNNVMILLALLFSSAIVLFKSYNSTFGIISVVLIVIWLTLSLGYLWRVMQSKGKRLEFSRK